MIDFYTSDSVPLRHVSKNGRVYVFPDFRREGTINCQTGTHDENSELYNCYSVKEYVEVEEYQYVPVRIQLIDSNPFEKSDTTFLLVNGLKVSVRMSVNEFSPTGQIGIDLDHSGYIGNDNHDLIERGTGRHVNLFPTHATAIREFISCYSDKFEGMPAYRIRYSLKEADCQKHLRLLAGILPPRSHVCTPGASLEGTLPHREPAGPRSPGSLEGILPYRNCRPGGSLKGILPPRKPLIP